MKASIDNNAKQIIRFLKNKGLEEITLKNLINDAKVNSDEFFSELDRLISQKKIILLITPAETYVLPLIYNNS
jgi:hypothetical protein